MQKVFFLIDGSYAECCQNRYEIFGESFGQKNAGFQLAKTEIETSTLN